MTREQALHEIGATPQQVAAVNRLAARCSVRGFFAWHDGSIQVGFESTATGRDREAVIAADGSRLETRNTYEH